MRRLVVVGGLAVVVFGFARPVSAQQVSAAPRVMAEQRQAAVQRAQQRRGAAMLQRLDKNADGVVARDEWPRAVQMFDRLDANKDGRLSAQELGGGQRTPLARLQLVRRQQLQARMRRLDIDKDGRLSRDEWRARNDGFARLDANKDGFLSPDELRRSLPRLPRR